MITTLAMTDTTTMLALFGAPGWLEIVALLMIGVLLFGRLAVTNALVNWFSVGPIAAFLVALVVVMPGGHLLGSRLSWRSGRG